MMIRKRWSTTGLAMLLSLAGCALLFFPWAKAELVAFDQDPIEAKRKGTFTYETMYGFQLWGGVASTSAFLTAFLLLVITGHSQRVPAWRSAALLACGMTVLVPVVGLVLSLFPEENLRINPEAYRIANILGWDYAPLAAVGLAGGLVVVGTIELRQRVSRCRGGE